MTLGALRVAVQPAGAPVAAKLTVPVKPLRLVTVIVEVAEEPALNMINVGFVAMAKSGVGTVTVMVTEWVTETMLIIAVPLTVTV